MKDNCHNCEKREILDDNGLCPFCRTMHNLAMARKLQSGEAIDLKDAPRTEDGDYVLDHYYDGKDYCDSRTEEWIWSIGIVRATKQKLASTGKKFFGRDGVHCLWLR